MQFVNCIGIAAFLALSSGITEAMPITFEFSGVINAVYDPDRYGDNIEVGDTYSATFTIDSAAPNQDHSNPNGGLYFPISATLSVGQVVFAGVQSDRQGLHVQAQASPALISLWSECSSSPDVGFLILGGTLRDWTGTALSSPAIPLPGSAPPLSAFQQAYFEGTDPLTKRVQFRGTVTSFEVTPEPSALSLMLLGSAALRTGRKISAPEDDGGRGDMRVVTENV